MARAVRSTLLPALLLCVGLPLVGCGATSLQIPPFQPSRPARMPLPVPDQQFPPVAIEVQAGRFTSLFHWVDSLAESSPGKNRSLYYSDWVRRFGPMPPEQRQLLKRFAAVRLRREPSRHGTPQAVDAECLPYLELAGPSRRQRLSIAAFESNGIEDYLQRTAALLDDGERAVLAETLRTFAPQHEQITHDIAYLEPFRTALARFLAGERPQALLARFARFYDVWFDPAALPMVHLVALNHDESPTHAEANGRHLLLEVRPSDTPEIQVQAVFHELAHHLFHRLPDARQRQLQARFYRQGVNGMTAWTLTYEALPTAFGQGLAQAILAPRHYGWPLTWYHIPEIDAAAKAIYPVLRQRFFAGGTLWDEFPEQIVERLHKIRIAGRITPIEQVGEGLIVAPEPVSLSLRALRFPLPQRPIFQVDPDTATGADFLRRAACLPVIGFVTVEDLGRLDVTREEQVRLPQIHSPLPEGAAGVVVPARRPSGAAALWVIAADRSQVERMVAAVNTMRGWPRDPVVIRR